MTIIQHNPGVAGTGGLGAAATDKTNTAPNQAAPSQAQAEPVSSTQPAEVEITPTAQLLANVAQQIAGTPDIDQSRVDAIRQALGSGSYQIDSGRIADGLLAAQKFAAQSAAGAQSATVKAFAATAQLGSDPS